MRILITGASGFIGSHLALHAARAGWEPMGTFRTHPIEIEGCAMAALDLSDLGTTLGTVSSFQPGVIVHAAACANLDLCEYHPEMARRSNVAGTENVVRAAESSGAHLIYLSTDSVFDGERGLYTEEDEPNPITVYAETKLEGEEIVLERLPATVVRTSINYGHRIAPHQASFYQDILDKLHAGKTITVFHDQYRNPIEVGHLAEALLELATLRYAGLLHVAGSQRCSRKEFAEAICRKFDLPAKLLIPKSQDEFTFRAPRSRDISMVVDKARSILSVPLPNVEEGLAVL